VTGYDFDQDYLDAGRARGLDLRTGDIDTAVEGGERYDLVILSHVVEHFVDPVCDLRRISDLLEPDGILYVEVPTLFTVDGQLLRYWQAAHTYSFVPATVRALADCCRLSRDRLVAYDSFAVASGGGNARGMAVRRTARAVRRTLSEQPAP
jgi:SAM-dependent methyltransferase